MINYIDDDENLIKYPQIDNIISNILNCGNYFVVKPLLTTQALGFSDIDGGINKAYLTQNDNEKKNLR